MKICGIVCEYNPFHNGHVYHIQKTREITNCELLLCVMSGNAVQRGEFAIADKWTRAKAAIEAGCDLVIELPYPYVVQRGDRFAHGALRILALAGVQELVFGSERQRSPSVTANGKRFRKEVHCYTKGYQLCQSLGKHLE